MTTTGDNQAIKKTHDWTDDEHKDKDGGKRLKEGFDVYERASFCGRLTESIIARLTGFRRLSLKQAFGPG